MEGQEIIQRAHEFKLRVQKSTSILMGRGKNLEESGLSVEDKDTQTEQHITQKNIKSRLSITFDDENFDSINLQAEDSIFDGQNPLLDINQQPTQSVKVKTEQIDMSDEEFEDDGTIVMVKSEENEDLVCDVNPFNGGGDDSQDKTDSKYKLHKCEQCNKCFSRATHLKRHKLTHEEGKLQCSICEKRFTRLDHLNLHVASNHSESKPYQCDVADCKKGFVRMEHLKKHIEAKHSEGTKDKEICDICQKTFASKKYLRVHMKSHSGDLNKGLVCKYCNVEFSEKTELNEHLTKDHQNEKPYLCSGELILINGTE